MAVAAAVIAVAAVAAMAAKAAKAVTVKEDEAVAEKARRWQ